MSAQGQASFHAASGGSPPQLCKNKHVLAEVGGRDAHGNCRECQREAQRRYAATPAGREAQRRRDATPAKREARRRWKATPAGREAKRRWNATHAGRYALLVAHAAERGIEVRLSFDEWRSLVIGASCHYGAISGESCSMPTTGGGLDRKDSSGAYEPGNVVACCKYHNGLKGCQSYDAYVAKLIARRERAA